MLVVKSDGVPDKYVAYFIAKYRLSLDKLDLFQSGKFHFIIGGAVCLISKLVL